VARELLGTASVRNDSRAVAMKLCVTLPSLPPGVTSSLSWQPMPLDAGRWRHETAGLDEDGARLVRRVQAETVATGWPCEFVITEHEQGAARRARRFHAFYEFLYWTAGLVVSGPVAVMEDLEDKLVQVAVAAEPDFDDGSPLTLAALWEPPVASR
jgi:hypothetical protein